VEPSLSEFCFADFSPFGTSSPSVLSDSTLHGCGNFPYAAACTVGEALPLADPFTSAA
jgi:hypothetical protein